MFIWSILRALAAGCPAPSAAACLLGLAACTQLPEAPLKVAQGPGSGDYMVGPGDTLQVFVWRSPELSTTVKVAPDGRISVPLIDGLVVSGRSASEIARQVEQQLTPYVNGPKVTVMVQDFVGQPESQIRVVGSALKPQVVPYRRGITVLDVVLTAGGLNRFADGNRATIVRSGQSGQATYRVRLADLLEDGDVSANVPMLPGDVLLIPERWF